MTLVGVSNEVCSCESGLIDEVRYSNGVCLAKNDMCLRFGAVSLEKIIVCSFINCLIMCMILDDEVPLLNSVKGKKYFF